MAFRFRRKNAIVLIFIVIVVLFTSAHISNKPTDTTQSSTSKVEEQSVKKALDSLNSESSSSSSQLTSDPGSPEAIDAFKGIVDSTVNKEEGSISFESTSDEAQAAESILEKQEIVHAIKEDDQIIQEDPVDLGVDELDDLISRSKSRKSKIPEQKERIKNNKSDREIKINVDDYSRSELRNIDVAVGNKPFKDFMGKFIDLITSDPIEHKHPSRLKVKDQKPVIPNVQYMQHVLTINEDELLDLLPFTNEFVEELYQKHENVVSAIPDEIPADFYDGNGYVMLGGGKYSWYALLVIQILRERGSKYPVEVVVPNRNEYEEEVCEDIFPRYNARCVVLSDVFGTDTMEKLGNNLNGYQYKSLAFLATSLQNIFFLDADCFPLTNLDKYFRSEVFKQFNMVTWPDFWRRTVSPYYYEVAGIEVSDEKVRHLNDVFTPLDVIHSVIPDDTTQISYHDRKGTLPEWSSETGGFLINKKEHFNTLLLSLFYNIDGPTGFHPLLSQGGAGEGDKETFTAAANYYNKPFYQVFKGPDKIWGWNNVNGFYDFTTIVQYDAITDFDNLIKNVFRINKYLAEKGINYDYDYVKDFRNPFSEFNSKPIFYHVHAPKLDPFMMFNERAVFDRNSLNTKRVRILGKDFKGIGFDFELMLWKLIRTNLCEDKFKFNAFKKKDMNDFCEKEIADHISFLEESHKQIVKNDVKNESTTPVNRDLLSMSEKMSKVKMTTEEKANVKKFVLSKMNIGTY